MEEDIQTDIKAGTTAGKPSLEHIEIIVNKAEHFSPLKNNKAVLCPPNKDSLCSSVESSVLNSYHPENKIRNSVLNSNLCPLLPSINKF